MIKITQGNLLEAQAEALVNTVNTVGVMGKGIALQFRQAYPEMFRAYAKACRRGAVSPGKMHVFERNTLENPRFIINFPTKRHWRGKSRLPDIVAGLAALTAEVQRLRIKSIAVPPLGCGNGGLDWEIIRPLIVQAFAGLPRVEVQIFAPAGAPAADNLKVATAKPQMSRGRALIILLLDRYFMPGYRVSLLEIQKLAYFLQEAGEPLRLQYGRNKYGPYTEKLNHVLQRIEGHYTRGYGDRSAKVHSEIMLLPGAVEAAQDFLAGDSGASEHLSQVTALIAGFENPYGMELLATVHWLTKELPEIAENQSLAVAKVKAWSPRKANLFKEEDIAIAWQQLRELGWFKTSFQLN